MAWQIPVSKSVSSDVAVNLNINGTEDSVFVAKGVLVASAVTNAIVGSVNNQQVSSLALPPRVSTPSLYSGMTTA